jgi:outer membrane protein
MKTIIRILVLAAVFVTTGAYAAADLVDVYQKALENDPTFQSAGAQRLSQRQAIGQARAPLLPNINAEGNAALTRQENRAGDLRPTGTTNFGDEMYTVTISQALFRFSDWMRYSQAKAVGSQADANYEAAKQDLIIRVALAYFNVLEAGDILRFTSAEKRANKRQLDQAKERHSVGLDAITSVYDAQAAYDAVAAREITADNDLTNAREALRAITGTYYKKLSRLIDRLPLIPPQPAKVEIWTNRANHFNATLAAAHFAAKAAKENMRAAFAGHFPDVDVVGTYERQNRGDAGLGGIDQRAGSLGLDISLPLYQGGLIFSQTKQARFDYLAAMSDMEGAYRAAMDDTRQSYNNIISGISTIKADRQTIISSQKSLESTEAALNVGTRTIVDLLDAQQSLYDAQRQLASDQYAYINNILALKQAAGTLNENDVVQVNRWLKTRRQYGPLGRSSNIFSKKSKAKANAYAAKKKSLKNKKPPAHLAKKAKSVNRKKVAASTALRPKAKSTAQLFNRLNRSPVRRQPVVTNARVTQPKVVQPKLASRKARKVAARRKHVQPKTVNRARVTKARKHEPSVKYGKKLGQVHTAKPVYMKSLSSKKPVVLRPNAAANKPHVVARPRRQVKKQKVAKPHQRYLPPVPAIGTTAAVPHRSAQKAKPWRKPKVAKDDASNFGFGPSHFERRTKPAKKRAQKREHKRRPQARRRHITGRDQVSRGDYINSLEYYATPRHPSSTR